jgi:hypothetical protein
MTVTEPGGPVMEGARSLEVRWILPGQLDMAVAGWFDRSQLEVESREDDYLLDPDMGGLSVKVRAGRALEVKVFRGSAGILDCPGRARGRMQYWQKWSFPFRPLSQDSSAPDGWRPVRKQRRINRYSLTGTRITTRPRELADEAWCAVELTELRAHHQDWWSLGFEATGPGDLLRTGLEATAALVFTQALPDGAELRMENSASYAEWLRARPHPQSSTAGDDGGGPGSEPENLLTRKDANHAFART